MKRSIKFYKTETGKCPTEEFLDSLPGKVAIKDSENTCAEIKKAEKYKIDYFRRNWLRTSIKKRAK